MGIWWVDFGVITHISIFLQGCLWSHLPSDVEKIIYMGQLK